MNFKNRQDYNTHRIENRWAWLSFVQPIENGEIHTYRGFKVTSGGGYWHIEEQKTQYATFEEVMNEIDINLPV